ncbi:rab proteins geranylgeranyltransferase component A-like [Ruditapes philippinarum]|uniref:rab proteins geranylgeranyltransferase component A-like n=1 Tax=Ruditapes philippinarum TaxID=129788 RepID=UPI00295B408E|nr:rab proteins geranylgeranyltransferase component A-like [Ruditapes philippinarum]
MLNMAMTDDLSKEFDVIVLGTGMPESIVAAACSRIGQTVLHLDKNDHYSGDWASFNLQGIEKWAQQHMDTKEAKENDIARPSLDESSLLDEGETLIELPLNNTNFSNTQVQNYLPDTDEDDNVQESEVAGSKLTDESPKHCDINDTKNTESGDGTNNKTCAEIDKCDTRLIDQQESSVEKQADCAIDSEVQSMKEQVENLQLTDDESKRLEKLETDVQDNLSESKQDSGESKNMDYKATEEKLNERQDSKSKLRWTAKRLKEEWRKFNLDLSPKVLYSVGDMVELLISSDIAKYCEFKTITQVITLMNGNLERVPCSRADVFSSKKVSMLEKRMLMKFLQYCLQYENKPEELGDFLEKPFSDFLSHKKLTPTIKHYIQHSIAMATESMTTKEGLEKTKKFLQSLGRYGNTAFLWSLYGSGELPQSFCRMCAVFGGVYCLRMTASSIVIDSENKCCGVITTEGHKIKCKWLIMEGSYAPENYLDQKHNRRKISRGIIMTETPLLTTSQQEQLSLMNLPCPDDGDRPITILELPPSSLAAPPGVFVYHLSRKSKDDVLPKDDLNFAINTLFSHEENKHENKPAMIWSLYFTQTDMSEVQGSSIIPDNVILMSGPGIEIDIDTPVLQARKVFKKILPDEEFLPKAPNPEDIIYVDDSEAQIADGNTLSEFSEKEDSGSSQEIDQSELSNTSESQSKPEGVDQSELSNTEESQSKSEGIHQLEASNIGKSQSNTEGVDQSEMSKTDESQSITGGVDQSEMSKTGESQSKPEGVDQSIMSKTGESQSITGGVEHTLDPKTETDQVKEDHVQSEKKKLKI